MNGWDIWENAYKEEETMWVMDEAMCLKKVPVSDYSYVTYIDKDQTVRRKKVKKGNKNKKS